MIYIVVVVVVVVGWLGPVMFLEYAALQRLESFMMEYISLPTRRIRPKEWDTDAEPGLKRLTLGEPMDTA